MHARWNGGRSRHAERPQDEESEKEKGREGKWSGEEKREEGEGGGIKRALSRGEGRERDMRGGGRRTGIGGGRRGGEGGGEGGRGRERERSEKEGVEERKVAAKTGFVQRSTGERGVGKDGQAKR